MNLGHNNFIMTTMHNDRVQLSEKKNVGGPLIKADQQKKEQMLDYDPNNSEFMRPLAPSKHNVDGGLSKIAHKISKSVVLSPQQVQVSLRQIFNFYARAYERPSKDYMGATKTGPQRIIMQAYFLFCKNFHILKAIFSIEKLTIIFKKHADYGKYLSFDNFLFMLNSMSHEQEAKEFFRLEQMTKNLDIETAEELEKQEFYNYLRLGSPERYREFFSELFMPFNMNQKPQSVPLDYKYRKFSLPELRKRALPQPKDKKKEEKDLFILKHDKNVETKQHTQFDEAKSIVVSWETLRSKSVHNLGKASKLVEDKYLKIDPQRDLYLEEIRPSSKSSPKNQLKDKLSRMLKAKDQIQKKIKQIEQDQNTKNKKILDRIQKKIMGKSSRKLQL